MKRLTYLAAVLAISAAPAHAHTGDHTLSFTSAVLHWLSSPVHSVPVLLAGALTLGFAVHYARKRT